MLSSWREFVHCKVPVVRARVEDIVRRVTGPTVLEVGCNEGWVAKAIHEERGFDVTAADNREKAIAEAREYFGIEAVLADACALPFKDGAFDCVVVGEILEHLDNPGIGLAEAFRVSRGHVVVTLPIGRYWNNEPTHAWQINASMIEHDPRDGSELSARIDFIKHSFVAEFRRIRSVDGGLYTNFHGEGYEDR